MRGLGAGPAPPVRPSGFSLCWVLSSAAYSYVVGAVMCSSVDAVSGAVNGTVRLIGIVGSLLSTTQNRP